MKNTGENKNNRKKSLKEIFMRLKTWQKILYLLWPVVITVILTQNFTTLIKLGNYRMNSISYEMTQRIKLEFDDYLLPVEHLINSMAANIEQMISEGADDEEIESFLVRQTNLMTGDFAGDSTGLYGYINGKYVDGAGWVPPEGYEPTERDWYIDTVAAGNRVAYVAPYIDTMTGENSVTVSRMLSDNDNIVALDLQLGTLQQIIDDLKKADTERVYDAGDSSSESLVCKYSMILDRNGKIVVHSDKAYRGQDIFDIEKEPFNSIAKKVLEEN
ncbi:MAG: cache domain-containing protein [Lachnospiraceae bacterium]|nr:cache domain-containing protein [Lachnospiraceae bacterium]